MYTGYLDILTEYLAVYNYQQEPGSCFQTSTELIVCCLKEPCLTVVIFLCEIQYLKQLSFDRIVSCVRKISILLKQEWLQLGKV